MDKKPTGGSFTPTLLLRNNHIQTLAGAYLRSDKGISLTTTRLDTADGDFIDLSIAQVENMTLGETAPVVLLLPGQGGRAQGSYASETYRQLAQAGVRCVGMNYRSCCDEVNRTPKTYYAGGLDDVTLAIDWLHGQFPEAPIGLIGFSFGGNMLLNLLGQTRPCVSAAVAISPPFDLSACAQALRGIYNQRVLSGLKRNIERKSAQLEGLIDMGEVRAARNIYEFDAVSTAPLHGFKDVEDYYRQCSSKQFVSSIQTPTLIIRALDDPFLINDIPFDALEKNACIQTEFPKYGGHVGFAAGFLGSLKWWAHAQATQFFVKQFYK